jgi:hypothetical protein
MVAHFGAEYTINGQPEVIVLRHPQFPDNFIECGHSKLFSVKRKRLAGRETSGDNI